MPTAITKRKVVVIDDSRTMIAWVAHALGTEECDVIGVTNSLEAPAVIFREAPDLVLVDVKMPVLQGDQIVELVRRNRTRRSAPVVLFSSLEGGALRSKAEQCGADGSIQKGCSAEEFCAKVAAYLTGQMTGNVASPISGLKRVTAGSRAVLFVGGLGPLRGREADLHEEFRVIAAAEGRAVADLVREDPPLVMVVNDEIADVSVAQFCEQVRADPNPSKLPLIYVGSLTQKASVHELKGKCDVEIFSAPFDTEDVMVTLRRLTNIAPRRAVRLMVRVSQTAGGQDVALDVSFSSNLSTTGMLVEMTQEVEAGALLQLRFFLPGRREEISTPARVARIKSRDEGKLLVGLQFEALIESHRTAIEQFVMARRGRPSS